jgi:hypothetical protein
MKSYEEVFKYALKKDKSKKAGKNFDQLIVVHCEDHTSCTFPYAEREEYDKWLIVYTEHSGIHIFPKVCEEDLDYSVYPMYS